MGERSSRELLVQRKEKRSVLRFKSEGGGEKENSLVLFYVVCVQLEPKRTRGMGRERGDGVSREERG